MSSEIRVVLLDVDGTLVDSNDAHARAWVAALAAFDTKVELEAVRRLTGKGGDKLLPEVSGIDAESKRGKAITEERGRIFKAKFLQRLSPFADVRPFIDRLEAEGLRVGVASSAAEDELQALLSIASATDLLPNASSADDADRSKPDPDIVMATLERMKARPEEAVLIGDTPYDVEAAERANIRAIGVLSGGWDRAALSGAIAV